MYNSKEKCKEIAQKIKELCNARGTTPYKVAVQAGLSTSTVSCFLSGKTIPKLDTMLMLCNSLGISITDIFDEREVIEECLKELRQQEVDYVTLKYQKS